MDCKQSRNMFVLRRTFDEGKLKRLCKGPLPFNEQVPRNRARCMPSENASKTQGGPDYQLYSTSSGATARTTLCKWCCSFRNRWNVYTSHFQSWGSAFHWQLELSTRKPGFTSVRATSKETLKIKATISKGSKLLYKRGIYPNVYMNSWNS